MFSYGGQNDDELCFETGDIITLISKVGYLNNRTWKYRFFIRNRYHYLDKLLMGYYLLQDEEAWWKGATSDGRTGVFPSNYVELIECK